MRTLRDPKREPTHPGAVLRDDVLQATHAARIARIEAAHAARIAWLLDMAGEPVAVQTDRGSAANEPIAKRKAPVLFVAALIRLIAEISKRAAEQDMPFDVTEMPGTKVDFQELAIKFDGSRFNKAPSTFDDYLAGLIQFKQGARETTFYQKLFPELFT